MTFWVKRFCLALLLLPLAPSAAQAQLRHHGRSVRALVDFLGRVTSGKK